MYYLQKYLEDPIAEEIIQNKIQSGDTLKIGIDKKTEVIKISIVAGKNKENQTEK